MKVLVVNAGSSSLKYQLVEMDTEKVLGKGTIERIGHNGSLITPVKGDVKLDPIQRPLANHTDAFALLIECLCDPEIGVIAGVNEIDAIGHRIVHSAESFDRATYVGEKELETLRSIQNMAPLHMPAHIACIESCRKLLPIVPNVMVFDTAFHTTMPKKASMYAIKYEDYQQYKIRKYGFHGASHRYVSGEAVAYLSAKGLPCGNIVTCHLGNGSSITAVKDGKSVDTSMGVTPLAGVPMGSRCGDIDAAAVEMLCEFKGWDVKQTLQYLNKECGFVGIGGHSDARDLCNAAKSGDERAQLAIDMFGYSVRKYIGAYAAAMNGLDCVVFTGGIGENSSDMREAILKDCDWLGLAYDPDKNASVHGKFADMTAKGGKVRILIVPTNEELVIARDTEAVVKAMK